MVRSDDQQINDTIRSVYNDRGLERHLTLEEFYDRVEQKKDSIGDAGGIEMAAALTAGQITHTSGESSPGDADSSLSFADATRIGNVQLQVDSVVVRGTIQNQSDITEFTRDARPDGKVVNITLMDNTGKAKAAFWDNDADAVVQRTQPGDEITVRGDPEEPYFDDHECDLSVTEFELTSTDSSSGPESDNSPLTDTQTHTPETNSLPTTPLADITQDHSRLSITARVLDVGTVNTLPEYDDAVVVNVCLADSTSHVHLSAWNTAAGELSGTNPGDTVRLTNLTPKQDTTGPRLSTTPETVVSTLHNPSPSIDPYEPDVLPIESLSPDNSPTVIAGRITDPGNPTEYTTDSETGVVRTVTITDHTGTVVVICWGELATQPYDSLDTITFLDAVPKQTETGIEAHINWSGAAVSPEHVRVPPSFFATQTHTQARSAQRSSNSPSPDPQTQPEDNQSSQPSSSADQSASTNPTEHPSTDQHTTTSSQSQTVNYDTEYTGTVVNATDDELQLTGLGDESPFEQNGEFVGDPVSHIPLPPDVSSPSLGQQVRLRVRTEDGQSPTITEILPQ